MSEREIKYKEKIIEKISSIEDKNILDEINRLIVLDIDVEIFITSTNQKKEILEARNQLMKNQGIPSEKADSEIEKWL